MTLCLLLLSVVALTAAVPVPRALTRSAWPEREPVVGLWVWQCLVATVLLCCLTALVLGAAAVFHTVRAQVFAPAPPAVTAGVRPLRRPAVGHGPDPAAGLRGRLDHRDARPRARRGAPAPRPGPGAPA